MKRWYQDREYLSIGTLIVIIKTSEDYLEALVEIVKYKKLDILLIAGDISNHYQLTHQFITQLTKQLDIPVKFVPGNHDLWEVESMTTQDIWNNYKEDVTVLGRKTIYSK